MPVVWGMGTRKRMVWPRIVSDYNCPRPAALHLMCLPGFFPCGLFAVQGLGVYEFDRQMQAKA